MSILSRRQFAGRLLGAGAAYGFAVRPRPKVLVWIVSEQFRSDYLERSGRWFGTAGLRRLLDDGSYFADCRMAASTFTASSLATLATGAWPSVHGIVADSWYNPSSRERIPASADLMLAGTLADEISSDTANRVFVVGSDPATAALWAGKASAQVLAFGDTGPFVSSGAAMPWVQEFAKSHSPEVSRNAQWMAVGARPGAPAIRKLTYESGSAAAFTALYRSSPFALADQFELVRELIAREKPGSGAGLDLIIVSLSAPAWLGYEVGGLSQLMHQMVLHVDRQIEMTLDLLNRMVGAGKYSVVFTGAHGAPRQRDTAPVSGDKVAEAIAGARGVKLDRYLYPFVYLKDANAESRRLAAEAATKLPEVSGFYSADADCSHTGDFLTRFEHSFHGRRSGDLMLAYAPERVELFADGRGVSYGSLYNYDTRVPLIFYGPQFRAETFEGQVDAVDVAPTLARASGFGPPDSAVGKVLGEAFAPVAKK